jgi:SAM-dependent methyltransferase
LSNDLKRYNLFGWDYAHFGPLAEKEITWYKNYAQKTGGPILELACGTGRLLAELAKSGFEVVGLDISPKMLEIANKNVNKLPSDIKNGITFQKQDITKFDLGRQFGLIYIADNSFRELTSRETQLFCLKAVHKHLTPNGLFLLTVRRFDFSSFVDGKLVTPWSKILIDPLTGNKVTRQVEFVLSENNTKLCGVYHYKTVDSAGNELFEECSFVSPILQTEDYFSLFNQSNLTTNLFIDYSEQQDDGTGSPLCFVCKKQ